MYSTATSGIAGSLLGITVGAGCPVAAAKFEPQLAQKRASGGLSYPQLSHRTDAIKTACPLYNSAL
jgi:hypothetical protein